MRTLVVISLLLTSMPLIQDLAGTLIEDNSPQEHVPLERIYGRDLSADVFNAISESSYLDLIIKLTENGSRVIGSENNVLARDWIVRELEAVSGGRMEVSLLGPHKSVVGRLPGYLKSGPIIMIGGHYDSVSDAPGANDDATGVAAAIEIARVLSQYEWPLDMYFCAWNAEEIGLVGSHEVSKIFDEWNIEVMAYYNIDMLLVEDVDAPVDERVILGYSEQARNYAQLVDFMSNAYGDNLIHEVEGSEMSVWERSDHASFLAEGFDSVMFAFESGAHLDTAYHSPSDTWNNPMYNYTVAIDAVAAIGASMAYAQARAHEEPMLKSFSGILHDDTPSTTTIPITVRSTLMIRGSWTDGTFTLNVRSPQGSIIRSINIPETSGEGIVLNFTTTQFGNYMLEVTKLLGSDTRFSFEVLYDTDLDLNGILDRNEFWLDPNEFEVDDDGDTLSNAQEIIIGTNPDLQDSDEDTLPDIWEYTYGTNPRVPDASGDPDSDLLTNLEEYEAGTNPMLKDTDMDLLEDSWEVWYGTNPLIADAYEDPDLDNLTNIEEYEIGTLPNSNDSDSDRMSDLFETTYSLNPLVDDAALDADSDDLTNLEEFLLGTNPRSSDSDGDLMPDAYEVRVGLNPLIDDAHEDPDGDGANNLEEFLAGTNPWIDATQQAILNVSSIVLFLALVTWLVGTKTERR